MVSKEWLIVFGTGALSVVLWNTRGALPSRGEFVDVAITVVPLDRHRLQCAMRSAVDRYRCAYKDERTLADPVPDPAATIAPYLTTDRTLYLVPGLFEVPSVRFSSARRRPDDRFVARCRLRLVAQVKDVHIRFNPAGRWEPTPAPTWIGEATSCEPGT